MGFDGAEESPIYGQYWGSHDGVYANPFIQSRQPSNQMFLSQSAASSGFGDRTTGAYESPKSSVTKMEEMHVKQQIIRTHGSPDDHQFYGNNVRRNDHVQQHETGRLTVSYGPCGGNGGILFDDGVYGGVREIHLTRSGGIVSIKACYDWNGQAVCGNKNGGTGGIKLDKISFNYPSEVLTHITGYYGSTILRGPDVVKSLTFHTNKRKYGPFGDEHGISFSLGSKDGVIVGFHGRKGYYFLYSIGVHVAELGKPCLLPSNPSSIFTSPRNNMNTIFPLDQSSNSFQGNPWNDGVFCGIKKICLTEDHEAICSLQTEYDRNGQSVWSAVHGDRHMGTKYMIDFDYPREYLTAISGYYGTISIGNRCIKVIKSVTFYTNRRKYGPYGDEMGTYFTTKSGGGKVMGLHGRSGCYLEEIGVETMADQPYSNYGRGGGPVQNMLMKIFA